MDIHVTIQVIFKDVIFKYVKYTSSRHTYKSKLWSGYNLNKILILLSILY